MNENLSAFEEHVALRYQIFNSIFLTLNMGDVHRTGIMLPILSEMCAEGLRSKISPGDILGRFFKDQALSDEKAQIDMLFRFIQFIERQVVLVDALEDAAYAKVNNLEGSGSLRSFIQLASNRNAKARLKAALDHFRIRIALTAHPTQFYPGAVLGIITDLTEAIKTNDLVLIKKLLAQLGKTPFFRKEKPTPYDEAVRLTWYLENIFYHTAPALYETACEELGANAEHILGTNPLVQLGFWPGGDRDGNPNVSVDTTLKVAERLKISLLKCYFRDVRSLKRRLTFRGVVEQVEHLETMLYERAFVNPEKKGLDAQVFLSLLYKLRETLEKEHGGLFTESVTALSRKVKIFGFYFGSIDVRQDSRVITRGFKEVLKATGQSDYSNDLEQLFATDKLEKVPALKDHIDQDTLESFHAMLEIQKRNGRLACYRYIISNCRGAEDVARVFALARMAGFGTKMYLDIIPLFETIDDLEHAGEIMEVLYQSKLYRKHLANRKDKQVVMVGFSDGTKDGGYITANWSIFRAKEDITAVSRKYGIRVVFFDGRGGPPARGGGNTHKFYASLGPTIESSQIQLTIQGQTISSNFGTFDSSRYNMEQLLTAGLENAALENPDKLLNKEQRMLLTELSQLSYAAYKEFKSHPKFISYLENMSPLKYYAETNIGSRPAKRGKGTELKLEDLRAIPFVGAWSQLKQNVPGFFGMGKAFEQIYKAGRLGELQALYTNSLFFRTLLDNSMQSLSKTNFELTRYMEKDAEYGKFWKLIYEECERTRHYLLEISGQQQLLESNPAIRGSIALREKVVLPLLTIQQFGLVRVRELEKSGDADKRIIDAYRKLVVRSLFGNINASRNSA